MLILLIIILVIYIIALKFRTNTKKLSNEKLVKLLINQRSNGGKIDLYGLDFKNYSVDLANIKANIIINRSQEANMIINRSQEANTIYNDNQSAREKILNTFQASEEINNASQDAKTIKSYDSRSKKTIT